MAVLGRVAFSAGQRVDLHDMLGLESFTAADFRALITSFVGNSGTYVVRGLQVVSKSGLTVGIKVSDSLVFNPLDTNASFYLGLSSDPDVILDLPADQTNIFVEGVFSNTTQSPVVRGIWDPLANAGTDTSGQEFSAAIDFQNIVVLEISANTTGFSDGSIPLFRASTSASAVTDFVDSRNLLFRLGAGGANPNPLNKYAWAGTRSESIPNGTGVGDAVDSPWRARNSSGSINDKAFGSFKEWMDAMMTRVAEISGNSLWYQTASGSGIGPNVSLQQLFFDTIGHSIQPSKNAAFKWSTVSGGLRLSSSGTLAINGITGQYHNGLIQWQANNTSLRWELGGTFFDNTPGGKRNYTAGGLRFQSPAPVDNGNIYLALEREVPKGSGNNVDWGDAGTSAFSAQESVSGSAGDFTGIALGDYIRKESGNINEYFKVVKLWDGTSVFDNSLSVDQNKIADTSIIALELQSVTDPDNTNISVTSEPLRYFRSRYSDTDVVADTTATLSGNVYGFQNTDFYWLGRRNGNLFYLREYGSMQEGEEANTLDVVYFTGGSGGSGSGGLVLEHAKEAVCDGTSGYGLKTGTGTLVTIKRRKRDNTVGVPGSGDNSDSLLTYTITAPVGAMTAGQSLWVRLSDSTSGTLAAGSVTNTTDDDNNTDVNTNKYEVRDAILAPESTFDNIDVFLLARRVSINGQPALVFSDGSILTEFGQMINTNLDISGELRLNDYSDTAIPFIEQSGTKLLDEDVTDFFYNKTTKQFGLFNFRVENNRVFQNTPEDVEMFDNLGQHTLSIGTADSTTFIPGNLIVDGTYIANNVGQIQSEDQLISLGVGGLLDQNYGAGFEVADDTRTASQVDTTIATNDVVLTFGVAHGYALSDIIGVNASTDVGGITAGQIGGSYTVVATALSAGDAEVLSPTTLKIIVGGGAATSTDTSALATPRTYVSPWSFRLGTSAGAYTGLTSWIFRVKGIATAPALTPVASYGVVPTADSASFSQYRIPFAGNDNQGPAGVDTTLDFSSNFTWNSATNTLGVVGTISVSGNINPQTDDTHDLGEGTTPLRWRKLHLGPGSDSGIVVGTANLYENGTDLLKTDDVFESAEYIKAGRMVQITETTSLTGPSPLPLGASLNLFQRDGLVFSQDAGGSQKLLTNINGNVYHENVSIVTTPSGNNQADAIDAGDFVTLPLDTKFLIADVALAETDGSTATVTVTAVSHGLTTGNLVTVKTSVDIGGILAADLSEANTAVTVIDPDTFTYVAADVSTSVATGFLDKVTAVKTRTYIVGSDELEVYDNGVLQEKGLDYVEVGLANTQSNSIQWLKDVEISLPTPNTVSYRIDSNGGKIVISQGSGAGTLQDAYNAGQTINITPGSPFIVANAGAGKAAVFQGDIDVTGVIDPKGITFDPQPSNPLPSGMSGLYISNNASLDLLYARNLLPTINVVQDFLYRDGSKAMTGDLDMGSQKITNLTDGISPTDAATFSQVSDISGDLPSYLKRDGSNAMTAGLDFGGFKGVNAATPTNPTDLTTKAYVDSQDRYSATYIDLTNNTGLNVLAGTVVALSQTTAGELVVADASVLNTAESTIGVVVANIADGATGKVQIAGRIAVRQATPFNLGRNVYLSEEAGEGHSVQPTTTGTVVMIVGKAVSTTEVILGQQFVTINANIYEETITVVSAAPANDNEVTGPVTASTGITIPNDSRNGNATKQYVVGSGQLQVTLNGVKLDPEEFSEVGTIGDSSSTFQVNRVLEIDDIIILRIELTDNSFIVAGGVASLQNAYNAGRIINVTSGNPVVINGPASEKLLVINGDLDVTGVIDPTGLQLTPQASSPFPSNAHGIYISTSGDLIHARDGDTPVNITQVAAASAPTQTSIGFLNGQGSTIAKATPVRIHSDGFLRTIDPALDTALSIIGVTEAAIADTAVGPVIMSGRILDITTTGNFGDVVYVSSSGGIIASSEFSSGDSPSIGVDGFQAGDHVLRLGVIAKSLANPAQKDLIVNIQIMGVL